MNIEKQTIIAATLLFLALTGCEQTDTVPLAEPKYTMRTPELLRSIPISDLFLDITIGNVTKTFQASDFPDGRWQIDFDLQANQTYDISAKWYSLNHLLLEETGQIFTDPQQQLITPELEFTSAGFDRFDDDCDGLSNLDEIRNGTNLNVPAQNGQSSCSDVAENIVLEANTAPWLIRDHKLFRTIGITTGVTSYEQSIQITETDPNYSSGFGVSLIAQSAANETIRNRVDFTVDTLNDNKRIHFEITQATNFQIPPESDAECSIVGTDTTSIECNLAYAWQEQQWYTVHLVRLEALSSTSWQATVRNDTSGLSQVIAVIETLPNLDWLRAQNIIGHVRSVPSEQCRFALGPIGMRFKEGVVNKVAVPGSMQPILSDCVMAGGGWSEGIRTIDDEVVYRLTLGRSE